MATPSTSPLAIDPSLALQTHEVLGQFDTPNGQAHMAGDNLSLGTPVESAPAVEPSRINRIGKKVLQVSKGEFIGTAFDIASMSAGVPLPVREVAGGGIDYKVYGPEEKEALKTPSRLSKIGQASGKVALYAVTGMVAQKYGVEAAQMLNDALTESTVGKYATPLGSKLGAFLGINATVSKFQR